MPDRRQGQAVSAGLASPDTDSIRAIYLDSRGERGGELPRFCNLNQRLAIGNDCAGVGLLGRLEALAPIMNPELKERLWDILRVSLADCRQA